MRQIKQFQEDIDVAGQIYNQIRLYDRNAFMAWGANSFSKNGPNNGIVGYMKRNEGHLIFSVNGPKFKGKIIVLCMLDDTYTVIAGRVEKVNGLIDWNIHHAIEDVYVDNLVNVIDGIVG